MRAQALVAWFNRLMPEETEVRVEPIIENASWLGAFGVWFYNLIHQHCPALHHIYFFIVEIFTWAHSRTVTYGGRYYRNLLKDFRPQLIISVHDSTNRGYFEDARRILGENKVKCVTYCGEFSGGYGFSRNWVNPTADFYYARTEEAAEAARNLGIDPRKVAVFPKLLPPDVFEAPIPREECTALKESLGLKQDKWTLFLATGGYGANHHMEFLRVLLPLAEKVQVIIICGRNQSIFQRLNRWSRRNPQLTLHLEGYSFRIPEYLQISDAVITRGGANTTMEALHFECPILYNTLGGLMPQEYCTTRYLLNHDAACLIKKSRDLAAILQEWIEHPDRYRNLKLRFQNLNNHGDPQNLVHSLQSLVDPLPVEG